MTTIEYLPEWILAYEKEYHTEPSDSALAFIKQIFVTFFNMGQKDADIGKEQLSKTAFDYLAADCFPEDPHVQCAVSYLMKVSYQDGYSHNNS